MAGKPQTLATTSAFEILGPVMVGPSSSHTAGALRCAQVAASLLEGRITKVTFGLWNSFAHTYRGHGTDRALAAGVMGMATDDVRLRDALDIARERGLDITFATSADDAGHPNTARIELEGVSGARVAVLGSSVGGGSILVTEIDGMAVSVTGRRPTFVVLHRDVPGLIAAVTDVLAEVGANICDFHLARVRKGGDAVMCIEVEGPVDPLANKRIRRLRDVTTSIVLSPV